MSIDKHESRRIRSEIRRVLLQYWDPIGIRAEPNAQDEYDSYLGGVYELLVSGASHEEIANHLWRIIEERIEIILKAEQRRERFANFEPFRFPNTEGQTAYLAEQVFQQPGPKDGNTQAVE